VDDDIFGFYISVDNALGVDFIYGIADLFHDWGNFILGHWLSFF